jgi:2-polyprenyl-3-methyl-5-hydroxy-6-metoxy-1,4-benzoquinol methylase
MLIKKFVKKIIRGFQFINYYPPFSNSIVDYDKYWEKGKSFGPLNDFQLARAKFILKSIEHNDSILDLGSGDGAIINYLITKTQGIDFTVSDISDYSLSHLKNNFKNVIKIDLNNDQFNFDQYDYVFMLELLEHIMNPEALLMYSLDKSNKGVFFSVPNTGYIFYRLRLLFGRFPMQWRLHPSEHIRFWTKKDLVWWLNSLGISNYEIKTYEGIPILNRINSALFSEAFVVYIKK